MTVSRHPVPEFIRMPRPMSMTIETVVDATMPPEAMIDVFRLSHIAGDLAVYHEVDDQHTYDWAKACECEFRDAHPGITEIDLQAIAQLAQQLAPADCESAREFLERLWVEVQRQKPRWLYDASRVTEDEVRRAMASEYVPLRGSGRNSPIEPVGGPRSSHATPSSPPTRHKSQDLPVEPPKTDRYLDLKRGKK